MAENVVQGQSHDPLRNFKFQVSIGDETAAGFSKVTGLRREIDQVEYREGDDPATPHKLPGQIKFPNVILERGVTADESFDRWIRQVVDITRSGNAGVDGQAGPALRRNVTIKVLDRSGQPIKELLLKSAWPVAHEYDDLDASSSDIWLNRLELAHEGLEERTVGTGARVQESVSGVQG